MVYGLVRFRDKIYVLDNSEINNLILREFHVNLNSGHLKYQKTLTIVNKFYHWLNLNKDLAEFIARYLDFE